MINLIKAMGAIFAFTLLSLYSGYVLSVLWGWFIVSTFDAPNLSIIEAIGICLIVGFFKTSTNTEEEFFELATRLAFGSLINSSVALVFGYVCFQFI
jgi:hypothetical protein